MEKSKQFYGWKLLFVLWLVYFNMCLLMYGGNVINAYMAKSLNMPRDGFGLGVALCFLIMGGGAPLAAFLVKKIGSRLLIFGGTVIMGIGALGCGLWVKNTLHFTIFYGIIGGIGLALGGLLSLQTVVTHWFSRKRSMATALLISAGGVGGLLSAALFNYLIDRLGISWQQTWVIVAGSCFLFAVVSLIFVRNHPLDLGQEPDGGIDSKSSENLETSKKIKIHQTKDHWVLKETLRTRPFWFGVIAFFAMMFGFNLCTAHGVIHLMEIGVANSLASMSIGLLAISSLVGRLLGGVLGDRFEPRYVISAGLFLNFVGSILITRAFTAPAVVVYAVFVGGGMGLVYVCMFSFMANYYGVEILPEILGAMLPISSIGGALAAYLGGFFQAQFGNYLAIFGITVVILFVAAIMMFFASPPKKQSAKPAVNVVIPGE
jgi:MFS family permease